MSGIIQSIGALVIFWGMTWRGFNNQSDRAGYLICGGLVAVVAGLCIS